MEENKRIDYLPAEYITEAVEKMNEASCSLIIQQIIEEHPEWRDKFAN